MPAKQTPVRVAWSAHVDTFASDNLPPRDAWPEFIFDRPELRYPPQLNCATALLDDALARGWGERTAILAPGGIRWTYAQLTERANRYARVLVEDLGLQPGNRVLLRGPNSPAMAACWFAVIKAGGIAVATMPLLRAKELTQIIDKARVSHALCDVQLTGELNAARLACPTLTRILHFGTDADNPVHRGIEALAAGKSPSFADAPTAADDTALIAFTSGTTGLAKGTMHFHRDVLAICDCWPQSTLKATSDDLFAGSPPLAFTFGLGGLLLFPLRIGAATLLLERTSPDALLAAIDEFRPSVLFTAPTSYRAMAARSAAVDLSSLRKCVSAGEALPAATRKLWKDATGIELIDGIGATEMLHIFISHTDDDARPGATGRPIPGYVACVMDEEGKPLPPGQVGRLAVKGPTGCRYLDDPRQSSYVQGGWNYTGDAYRMDEDGWFIYHARTDDMIVSSGYNIAGPEVEGILLLHPAVADCACVGSPDEERGMIVKAFVVLKPGYTGDDAQVEALQAFVKREVAPYKYPRAIEFVESLPRTETGKVQRFRLRQLEIERAAARLPGGAS